MKVIIAGNRDNTTYQTVEDALRLAITKNSWEVTEIVSGMAPGVDTLALTLAIELSEHEQMPVKKFPADWSKYGRSAGPRRNAQMAEYADALIAVWDGESRGTQNMIDQMIDRQKPVYIHFVDRKHVKDDKGQVIGTYFVSRDSNI